MSKVRVLSFGLSLDGYGAGPDQSLEQPLGAGFIEVMEWFFPTQVWKTTMKLPGEGERGIDNEMAEQGFARVGAWILGRNMFGPPDRGPWREPAWNGWWGEEPPYHVPVFVLTHHPREPLVMKGGTVFHFVTGGIHEALEKARVVAAGSDIRVGGGVATVRQFLQAGLLDTLHLAMRPVVLGRGESLFQGLDLPALGYECEKMVAGERATHVFLRKKP